MSTVTLSQTSKGGMVRDIQHAINAARKVEQRLTKLQGELTRRGKPSNLYVHQMMQALLKERTRFAQDKARLTSESEIQELDSAKQHAYQDVKQVAVEMHGATPRPLLQARPNEKAMLRRAVVAPARPTRAGALPGWA